mmetsp:Transcript_19808/g.56263  ORF Transcript_19808/g.56263 Transcript_19808/m.56263 type:complete len:335 (+) Transcript_19808:343-1347(+)
MYILLLAAASVRGQREAVVVPVGPKNRTEAERQCVRQRLEAIVDSSGGGRLSGRPVYALSNESWVASATQTYGVVQQQNFTYFGYHTSPWRSFAGQRSGVSKPAFVRWLADSKYVAAWHIEEDVFFTGRWRDLFASAPPGADLVARFSIVNGTWNPSPGMVKQRRLKCRIGSKKCTSGLVTRTAWSVLRMTRRFAKRLAEAFDANAAEGYHEALTAQFCYSLGDSDCKWADLPESAIGTLGFGGERVPASMANEKGWRRRPKDTEYTLDFAATLGGKLVAGKKLYHPVKCAADAKLGALARGMAQGHNSMEMSTPRQDMLVGALEGFLEDLPSS